MSKSDKKKQASALLHRAALPTRSTAQMLRKQIFEAENPVSFARRLPAQALQLILLNDGLLSSSEIIALASVEQTRLLIDFDCWHLDRFDEEKFWQWLELADTEGKEDGLRLLQKVVASVDLKLISLLIDRYLKVVNHEEPTDKPPADGFYSPDKGNTWIRVETENEHKDFLLNRLMAMIFETDAKVFYQLLGSISVATQSMLEEESFQEREKRLRAEGVPDQEFAAEICTPMALHEALSQLEEAKGAVVSEDILPISPLVYKSSKLQPLQELFENSSDLDSLEGEFTLLLNAAIVRFGINFGENTEVTLLVEQVRGAVNIGLEKLIEASSKSAQLLHTELGLKGLFGLGLFELFELRKKLLRDLSSLPFSESVLRTCLERSFPAVPKGLISSEELMDEGNEPAALSKLSECKALLRTSEVDRPKA